MTLDEIIKEVIFEEKQKNLKVIYDIDVNISLRKKTEDVPDLNQTEPNKDLDQSNTTESKKDKGTLLNESSNYVQKASGTINVPYNKAMNIQTINDLVEYLSGEEHIINSKQSPMEKILDKNKKIKAGKIISPAVQDIILILSGTSGQTGPISDLINKEDKIIISIMYGNNETDNIGFKINKNAGTEVASTTIIKDGEILPGRFDSSLINKQILFYRNSLN